MKSRYSKPFEGVQIKIPYETGMDTYSGLVDLFEKKRILSKDGNRLKYVDSKKTEYKEYRRVWEQGGELLDNIMKDFSNLEPVEDKETVKEEE